MGRVSEAAADSRDDDEDQGLIEFIRGNYSKALASWQKAVEQDESVQKELEPWMAKAKAKLGMEKGEVL